MTFTTIKVATNNRVTTISINRPEARNSLTAETIQELTTALQSVHADKEIGCVLVTGEGSDSFCAGADIKALIDNGAPDKRRAFFNSVADLIQSIRRCPVPVVGAVQGFAIAGGCGLAAACDICIASDDAVFGLPEVAIGLAPLVVMLPLSRSVRHKALAYLALSAEKIQATQALAIGLVTEVVPKSGLMQRALEVCEAITKQGPEAIKATKAALVELSEGEFDDIIRELADRSALVSLGAEAKEGLLAFREKRPPSWRT